MQGYADKQQQQRQQRQQRHGGGGGEAAQQEAGGEDAAIRAELCSLIQQWALTRDPKGHMVRGVGWGSTPESAGTAAAACAGGAAAA